MGDIVHQMGHRSERFQQLKAATDWLASNCSEPVVIPELAASAGMSATSFHRHFKALTGHSPLAFQRKMRLVDAKNLLAAGDPKVWRVT